MLCIISRGFLFVVLGLLTTTAGALPITGITGGGQPFDNMQPSLVINEFVQPSGLFPGNSSSSNTIGSIRMFAGNFGPGGAPLAQGQLMSIAQNTALFSLLGTTYGGNGLTTFALPDLSGRVGAGWGPVLLGEQNGTRNQTLSAAQLPVHAHTLQGGGLTGNAGGAQPFDNRQPSLGLNYVIALQGIYPTQNGGGGAGGNVYIGQVAQFAGNFAPQGFAFADGQLLSIAQNTALFSLIGTTYGGNGVTTFALPDLRGRTVIGTGQGPGLTNRDLGEVVGVEQQTLTTAQMPAHTHGLPPSADMTDVTGGSQPFSNMQPSLAMNYLIALQGAFPSRGGGNGIFGDEVFVGELILFSGNFAPAGWAVAAGQLLPIAQNTALFSLLGTTYGGNGVTTFALPDLRGRALMGAGDGWMVGDVAGTEAVTLSLAQLPAHIHTLADSANVPEPHGALLFVSALGLLGAFRGRAGRK